MTHILAQVRIQRNSLLPEDMIINTFHFDGVADSGTADVIATRLSNFYNAVPAGSTTALKGIMGAGVFAASGHEIRLYDQAAPQPRTPFATRALSVTWGSGTPFPCEVALCLSFRGPNVSGSNPARRRGRIYIGPLLLGTTELVGPDIRPSLNTRQILANAGVALANASDTTVWCVWSEASGLLVGITDLWVDNALDTQRRRGAKPTLRETRTKT